MAQAPATPGPRPLALLDAVSREVTALRESAPGDTAGDWAHEARETAITQLDTVIEKLTVYRGQLLLAHQQKGRWGSARDRDFADWRGRSAGTGRGPALGEMHVAQSLDAMPQLAEAVEHGRLTLEHVKVLDRVRRNGSSEVQQAMTSGGLDELVEKTARTGLSAPDLGKRVKTWAATIDAEAAQQNFDAVRRRRSLTMRNHAGGVAGEFFLDPVAGAELRTALDAIAGPPAKNDERTKEQRTADAIQVLASRTLLVGADLTGAQVRPHLSLLVSAETWSGVVARRGQCNDGSAPLPEVAPGELEDGTVVPVRELERLMCDCEITRMVLSAPGVPLDVGRTERTYTKELRRAVTVRDRHCQWPSCRIRASWCEVHHITWFSRGGKTSLAEGICLCSFHHHRVHELDARITVRDDGFDFHLRDGTSLGGTTRHALSGSGPGESERRPPGPPPSSPRTPPSGPRTPPPSGQGLEPTGTAALDVTTGAIRVTAVIRPTGMAEATSAAGATRLAGRARVAGATSVARGATATGVAGEATAAGMVGTEGATRVVTASHEPSGGSPRRRECSRSRRRARQSCAGPDPP